MDIFKIIIPDFAIAFRGHWVAYKKVLSSLNIAGHSSFVFALAILILLGTSIIFMDLLSQLNWLFPFLYNLVVIIAYLSGVWLSRSWFAGMRLKQGIFGLEAILYKLPIFSSGFGGQTLPPSLPQICNRFFLLFTVNPFCVQLSSNHDKSY